MEQFGKWTRNGREEGATKRGKERLNERERERDRLREREKGRKRESEYSRVSRLELGTCEQVQGARVRFPTESELK
jgi:hypothetical protein